MKLTKCVQPLVFTSTLFLSNPSFAGGIPVIDVTAIAEAVKTLVQLEKQFDELQQQTGISAEQLEALTGARGLADLVNDPSSRYYIPAELGEVLKLTADMGGGDYDELEDRIQEIMSATRIMDVDEVGLEVGSTHSIDFSANQNQVALNSALAEQAYNEANKRTQNLQVLLERINIAEDPKEIADLNARIAAEQLMLTNETNKLTALQQSQTAYRERQSQRTLEKRIQSTGGKGFDFVSW